jgi:hypothetical protein
LQFLNPFPPSLNLSMSCIFVGMLACMGKVLLLSWPCNLPLTISSSRTMLNYQTNLPSQNFMLISTLTLSQEPVNWRCQASIIVSWRSHASVGSQRAVQIQLLASDSHPWQLNCVNLRTEHRCVRFTYRFLSWEVLAKNRKNKEKKKKQKQKHSPRH